MTKDAKRKKEARALAAERGISYTAAKRLLEQGNEVPEGHITHEQFVQSLQIADDADRVFPPQ